jgi:hypothetical protein
MSNSAKLRAVVNGARFSADADNGWAEF